ncbi:homoserine dehydrogenase [Trueperella bernardiae]|uniref:Homoserine dehydrogenase n=1 Tax=Trueperella bernardiae TaxID=59561 RepID=A0AAW6ZIB2_9ACTO|nr:homoserine dehydrogenase [Trueperella bernardiae]MDK8601379.1 homoserine dehydrogenase [Trueperella bernardiae]OCW60869.1 homoserine dehydrogenase [Trueperella bernardiae]
MSIKIALLGCGTVGTQVARLLSENNALLSARAGADLELIGIAVSNLAAERDPAIDRALLTTDAAGLIEQADVVIELIGGIEPPRTLIRHALESGASVVTGNKALLAEHGPELYDLAKEKKVDLYYEAAVAGAVPVVYAVRESLAGDSVKAIKGILNGTTNYILDEMTTKGLTFDEVLATAQELGYAEADPTADVDGFDAAAKIAILASLAFHKRVSLADVDVEGIRSITDADIEAATKNGYVIKLVATATQAGGKIETRVAPSLVPVSHPLASIGGSFNAVVIEAESADRLMFYGRGAGGAPTASAVLSDVVAAAAKKVLGGRAPQEIVLGESEFMDAGESVSRYFVRLQVADRVGVLAEVTDAFAEAGVSISAVNQEVDDQPGLAALAITTHAASAADMAATIEAVGKISDVHEVVRVFRVEDE